ncbi:MAG: zincin-like metallopeptidase domain-containing protein [Bacteroidia bacterium]|nr:zincin-like metallopeptidase domain-containing protein [Bacteroidia bacterium]
MAKKNIDEKFLSTFTNLMINRIKDISEDWKQPWINTNGKVGLPQNLDGRNYRGLNSLVLYFVAAKNGYELPVYTTFKQAKENGLSINKGSESTPIVYWNYFIKDKVFGEKITIEDWRDLSNKEKEKYNVVPYMRHYNVFNVEQTNIREAKPELWEKLEKQFTPEIKRDEKEMFVSEALDNMVKRNSWAVPIYLKVQDGAYYNKTSDYIAIPQKNQFVNGESFYSTMLHEMAHSTGHPERLNREMGDHFGSREYGREELVAELTAAVSAQSVGIATTIRDENAQYLKAWLKSIKEYPDFLLNIMNDVNKASNMVLDVVEKEQLKIYQDKEETLAEIHSKEKTVFATQAPTEMKAYKESGFNYDNVYFDTKLSIDVYKYLLKNGYDSIISQADQGKSFVEVPRQYADKLVDAINKNELIEIEKKTADKTVDDKEQHSAERITDVHVFKHYTGQYAVQCFIDGKEQQPEILSYSETKALFKDKSISTIELAQSKYEHSLSDNEQSIGMKR